MDTLLTPEQLDTRLAYPRGRCMKLVHAGQIPHVALPDGEIRFDEKDVYEWLERCKRGRDTEEAAISVTQ